MRTGFRFLTFTTLLLIVTSVFSARVLANGSTPRLNLISPRGVQRGFEHVLRFSGERLSETQQVFLYDSGIEVVKINQVDANNVDVIMKVDADCRLGEHIAQLRTSRGISDFARFMLEQ